MTDARLRVVEPLSMPGPLDDAEQVIAEWLRPGAAAQFDVELRSADGTEVQVESAGDALTIRGVVLTLRRRDQPDAFAGARKMYF